MSEGLKKSMYTFLVPQYHAVVGLSPDIMRSAYVN